jgi:hypothetical protein
VCSSDIFSLIQLEDLQRIKFRTMPLDDSEDSRLLHLGDAVYVDEVRSRLRWYNGEDAASAESSRTPPSSQTPRLASMRHVRTALQVVLKARLIPVGPKGC